MINDSFQETLPRPVPTPSRVAAGGEVETPSVKPGAPSALVAKPPKQTRQEKHCDLNGCEPILACYASMDPFIIFIYIYSFTNIYIYICWNRYKTCFGIFGGKWPGAFAECCQSPSEDVYHEEKENRSQRTPMGN